MYTNSLVTDLPRHPLLQIVKLPGCRGCESRNGAVFLLVAPESPSARSQLASVLSGRRTSHAQGPTPLRKRHEPRSYSHQTTCFVRAVLSVRAVSAAFSTAASACFWALSLLIRTSSPYCHPSDTRHSFFPSRSVSCCSRRLHFSHDSSRPSPTLFSSCLPGSPSSLLHFLSRFIFVLLLRRSPLRSFSLPLASLSSLLPFSPSAAHSSLAYDLVIGRSTPSRSRPHVSLADR